MSTEFISMLAPPGDAIKDYDRTIPPTEQHASVPRDFLDVMKVREEVFVKEQHVPLERELDLEDARSYHWIVYASVGAPRGHSTPQVQRGFGTGSSTSTNNLSASPGNANNDARRSSGATAQLSRSRSASTASRTAVGTIRLVPPHVPQIGSRRSSRNKSISSESVNNESEGYPHPTVFPSEPYIRIGRLATLKEFRGLGLAKLLVNAALQYARQHPNIFIPRHDPAEVEAAKLEGRPIPPQWNGLVYVHAQKGKTDALWKKWGFTLDEGMGTWDEEGMDHVGMWKRLEVVHS